MDVKSKIGCKPNNSGGEIMKLFYRLKICRNLIYFLFVGIGAYVFIYSGLGDDFYGYGQYDFALKFFGFHWFWF